MLTSITFLFIYLFFSAFREEEFQQRQKDKITSTLKFLAEIKEIDNELIEALDRMTIHELFDEKLLLFNSDRTLIYASIDDTPVMVSKEMLYELGENNKWIETKDGLYDVIGTYVEKNGKTYYGISKAYDTFGYTKLNFLRNVLLFTFFIINALVLLIGIRLAKKIAKPITDLANSLNTYRIGESSIPILPETTTYEINKLNTRFLELVKRSHDAFDFQKHSIQHISHQLKTPIAVLISELERIRNHHQDEWSQKELDKQILDAKALADIINVLLEISKIESGQPMKTSKVRVDEVIFDCIAELNSICPDFMFDVNYLPEAPDHNMLCVNANEMLMKQIFNNLLSNCIAYSEDQKASISICCKQDAKLQITITNTGKPLLKSEEKYVFNHFFRGENSQGKPGFGLGLVLTQKVIHLYHGQIVYSNPQGNENVFIISLPLS